MGAFISMYVSTHIVCEILSTMEWINKQQSKNQPNRETSEIKRQVTEIVSDKMQTISIIGFFLLW